MIEVGVPPENHKPTFGNALLKIDCSKIAKSSIDYLVRTLRKFLNIQLVDGDLIYAEGKISGKHYVEVWKLIECFNVTVLD